MTPECLGHKHGDRADYHQMEMATSYYPRGVVNTATTCPVVVGVTGTERSANLTAQLKASLEKQAGLLVNEIKHTEKLSKSKFRMTYSDYTVEGILKRNWFEKHTRKKIQRFYCLRCPLRQVCLIKSGLKKRFNL